MPQISNILQDVRYHVLVPENLPGLLIIVGDNPPICLVLTRRRDSHIIELFIDSHIAHAFGTPLINHPDYRCSFRIHDQLIFVLR